MAIPESISPTGQMRPRTMILWGTAHIEVFLPLSIMICWGRAFWHCARYSGVRQGKQRVVSKCGRSKRWIIKGQGDKRTWSPTNRMLAGVLFCLGQCRLSCLLIKPHSVFSWERDPFFCAHGYVSGLECSSWSESEGPVLPIHGASSWSECGYTSQGVTTSRHQARQVSEWVMRPGLLEWGTGTRGTRRDSPVQLIERQ